MEIDTRSCVNPSTEVGLTTEDVRAQRPRSGGRANALFDQVILRCLMRTGVTARSVSDNLIQVNRHRSVAWPHPSKIWRVIVRVKIQFQTQELEQTGRVLSLEGTLVACGTKYEAIVPLLRYKRPQR